MPSYYTFSPNGYFDRFYEAVEAHLVALKATLRSIEDGSFGVKAATPRPGAVVHVVPEKAPRVDVSRLCNRCFVSMVGELLSFLDRMISLQRATTETIALPPEFLTGREMEGLIRRFLEDQYARVARDRRLTNPKKLEYFQGIDPFVKLCADSFFALRRCIEHHGSRPVEDIALRYGRLRILAGDHDEILSVPYLAPEGAAIKVGMDHATRLFPAGELVAVTEPDLEGIAFTLQHLIATEVWRVLPFEVAAPADT